MSDDSLQVIEPLLAKLKAISESGMTEEQRIDAEIDVLMDWHFDTLAPTNLVTMLSATPTDADAYVASYDALFAALDPETLTVSAMLSPLMLTNSLTHPPERLAAMPNRATYRAKVVKRLERECPDQVDALMRNY